MSYRWGDEWGGADEATAVWFRRSKRRLEGGRERSASKAGDHEPLHPDVANPMHTEAGAWSNGTGGCNSCGSHDWTVDKAMRWSLGSCSWRITHTCHPLSS
jgi:hypothetical protein